MKALYLPLFCIALSACSLFGSSPVSINPELSSQGPLIARAIMLDSCDAIRDDGQEESALAATLLSLAVQKGAEAIVGVVSDAIEKAAKEDRETLTIKGQSADFLYVKATVDTATPRLRRCIAVVVAPRIKGHDVEWNCKDGPYSNEAICANTPIEVKNKWKEWQLGTPVFYAEVALSIDRSGPANVAIPTVKRIFYPKPLSNRDVSKVKGLTISVTASKPSKSSTDAGDTVLEIFLGGDGVTPTTVSDDFRILQTSGLWVAIPSAKEESFGKTAKDGKLYGVPVNLTATIAETPNPTAWLQAVAKYVGDNKQKAVDAIVNKVDPAKRAEEKSQEFDDKLQNEADSIAACIALDTGLAAVTKAKGEVSAENDPDKKRTHQYALQSACISSEQLLKKATLAWTKTGTPICDRDTRAELTQQCP